MRIWRASLVGVAALMLVSAACTSGDDGEQEAFDLTGRVVTVEPGAQPAEANDTDVIGAIVVQTATPEGCETDPNGVRVYVERDTDLPGDASDDLDELRGETVTVSGSGTQDGDACTLFADTVSVQGADASPAADDADESTGGTGSGGGSKATSEPGATASPNDLDDEGSITETDEKTSPRPNPDEEDR